MNLSPSKQSGDFFCKMFASLFLQNRLNDKFQMSLDIMQRQVHTLLWNTNKKEGGVFMKTKSRFILLFVLTVLCSVLFPLAAAAKPHIAFRTQHVYLHRGEAEIVGFFENTGDEMAYAKRFEFDLVLIADNGQQIFADYGIRHYVNSVRVPAGRRITYTFYVRNPRLPDYRGKYSWRIRNPFTTWSKAAG